MGGSIKAWQTSGGDPDMVATALTRGARRHPERPAAGRAGARYIEPIRAIPTESSPPGRRGGDIAAAYRALQARGPRARQHRDEKLGTAAGAILIAAALARRLVGTPRAARALTKCAVAEPGRWSPES